MLPTTLFSVRCACGPKLLRHFGRQYPMRPEHNPSPRNPGTAPPTNPSRSQLSWRRSAPPQVGPLLELEPVLEALSGETFRERGSQENVGVGKRDFL